MSRVATGTPGLLDTTQSQGTPGLLDMDHDTTQSQGTPGLLDMDQDTIQSQGTPGLLDMDQDTAHTQKKIQNPCYQIRYCTSVISTGAILVSFCLKQHALLSQSMRQNSHNLCC